MSKGKLRQPVRAVFFLLLLTLGAFLVQGYHLGADDAEVYLPAIKQVADPQLYPARAQFFLMHAQLSHFADIVGGTARLLHVGADYVIFASHILCLFLLLAAGWCMAGLLFQVRRAVWGAVGLLALLLSVPVAGTALPIADAYLTARSLSTPLALFALHAYLRGHKVRVLAFLFLAGLVHPLMVVYTAGLIGLLALPAGWSAVVEAFPARAAAVPAVASAPSVLKNFTLQPAEGGYHDLLYNRTFFFINLWPWWEWVGVVAPLAMLFAAARVRLRSTTSQFQRVARALILFGLLSTAVAILFSLSPRFDSLERLQVMRSFHMIYIIFFLMLGGLLAEFVLQGRVWRWLALFVPLAAGMYALNWSLYSSSPHIEVPGVRSTNPWVRSFYWVRTHTPTSALFALSPRFMNLPGEDEHGFRAIAERSRLADYAKDSGVVAMFPQLLPVWEQDQTALRGWNRFTAADFARLHAQMGVSWVVLNHPVAGLRCPHVDGVVRVCETP